MALQKRKAGRPVKATAQQKAALTLQESHLPLEASLTTSPAVDRLSSASIRHTGLVPISEEEYNRLNGIVPELPQVEIEPIIQTLTKETYINMAQDAPSHKGLVGTFIVVNTPHVKGVRLNLEKVRTYARAGGNSFTVQVAWDNGSSSQYDMGSDNAAEQFLALLDSYCL